MCVCVCGCKKCIALMRGVELLSHFSFLVFVLPLLLSFASSDACFSFSLSRFHHSSSSFCAPPPSPPAAMHTNLLLSIPKSLFPLLAVFQSHPSLKQRSLQSLSFSGRLFFAGVLPAPNAQFVQQFHHPPARPARGGGVCQPQERAAKLCHIRAAAPRKKERLFIAR